jgi:hypothetical protein
MPFFLLAEAVKKQHEVLKNGEKDSEEPQKILRMATDHAFYFLEGRELDLFLELSGVVTFHMMECRKELWGKPKPDPKVYFVRSSEGLIKIGFTTKPIEERLAQFRNISSGGAFLLATVPGSKQDESFLHRTFKKNKAHGEWFNPSPRLLKTIQKLKDGASISEAVKD